MSNLNSVAYPGHDVKSLRYKYYTLHCRKNPTEDHDIPDDIRLAKSVKYGIGERARLGREAEDYDLEVDKFVSNLTFQLDRVQMHILLWVSSHIELVGRPLMGMILFLTVCPHCRLALVL